jgi:uncharacterized protein
VNHYDKPALPFAQGGTLNSPAASASHALRLRPLPHVAQSSISGMVRLQRMDFFCYHRDRPDSASLREELVEQHWSYMDRYDAELIARGPTFTDDETPTGSVHIVDLPDPAAARVFAFDEPNYQAGAYRDVLLRRFRNLLGRTMWEFPGDRNGGRCHLVLGLGAGATEDPVPSDTDALIAYGSLLSDDGTAWLGTAALVQTQDPAMARAILRPGRYAAIEVHNWEFGGRR